MTNDEVVDQRLRNGRCRGFQDGFVSALEIAGKKKPRKPEMQRQEEIKNKSWPHDGDMST